jgi:hypothetical protein
VYENSLHQWYMASTSVDEVSRLALTVNNGRKLHTKEDVDVAAQT